MPSALCGKRLLIALLERIEERRMQDAKGACGKRLSMELLERIEEECESLGVLPRA